MRADNPHTGKIDDWFSKHTGEMMSDLSELIAIRSVAGSPVGDMPFGKGSFAAITEAARLTKKNGFSPRIYDNCMMSADMNDGETELAILAHVDVVEEGDGWDTDPFTLTERDGYLYGRGVADDKGPAIAALYALRAAREITPELTKNCRIIFGSAEEIGMGDLGHYVKMEKFPKNVFSPDADFPLINIEKGRFLPRFKADFETESALPRIVSIKGGSVSNIVPHRAAAVVAGIDDETMDSFCREYSQRTSVDITFEHTGDTVTVTAVGVASHASAPQEGRNAQTAIISMLTAMPFAKCRGFELLCGLARLIPHGDTCGKNLGVEMSDSETGELTVNFGVFEYRESGMSGDLDMRTPACGEKDNLYGRTAEAFRAMGFECDVSNRTLCHITPADSEFVSTLLGIYEQYTGNPGECIAIGGSTYVHEIEGGVAFGCNMPGTKTNIHGANENMLKEHLMLSAKMFTQAIIDICR